MIAGAFVGIVRKDVDILVCSQKDKPSFQCRPGPTRFDFGMGDEIATRHGIQKWLDQPDQSEPVVRGIRKRKAVVAALASGT